MAKFAAIAKGSKARKTITFPTLTGEDATCDVGVLVGEDDAAIVAKASVFTRSSGAEAKDGDPVFAFAVDCETVARAFIDSESPAERPEPYFVDADQVRKHLDRDRIFHLAKLQRDFQSSVSPSQKDLTPEQFVHLVFKIAAMEEGDDLPFEISPPRLLKSFLRGAAGQLASLMLSKSPTSSDGESEGSTPTSTEH